MAAAPTATADRQQARRDRPAPASEVPGPRLPRLVQTLLGVIRPLEARLEMRERYGPVVRSNDAIAGELFHITERELIEQIFEWKPAQYNVGEPRQVMEPVAGPSSILLLDAQHHLRMRKLMLPPFHGEAIAHYAELIGQITNREIDTWHEGETIPTRTVAQRITMEVIIRAVFGITDPERIAELQRVLPRLSSPNPLLLLVQKDLGPRPPGAASPACAITSTGWSTRRSTSAAPTPTATPARTSSPCSVRPRRSGRPADRPRAARRADHNPPGRTRNHRHIDRLGIRATAPHPGRSRAPDP